MQPQWIRCRKWCLLLSSGAVTFGWLQGLSMVNFASLFTEFLSRWLSLIVTVLFGGEISDTALM